MNRVKTIPGRRTIRLIGFLVLLAALVFGYRAWLVSRQARVVVEWSTASEVDTAGYYLYRSEKPGGPFDRVNKNLIPASNDPLVGGSYSYEDTGVQAGKTYYYQLEDIELDGSRTIHGPIEIAATSRGRIEMLLAAVLAIVGAAGAIAAPRFSQEL
jgi:hypothetical protein